MDILILILSALYFMLPAYIANALPVISSHFHLLPNLATPIDCNSLLFGKPLFGHSKTIRGFVVGIVGGMIIGIIQYFLYSIPFMQSISLIEYNFTTAILLGILLGFGALLGDLGKSFLKRRIGKKSGSPWFLADQLDYVFGAIILGSIVFIPTLPQLLVLIIASPLLAITANIIAYKTGMKKVWW